jgi:predicted HicB family RNase H-like nuclease
MVAEERTLLNIRVRSDIAARIKAEAERRDISMAKLVNRVMEDNLGEWEDQEI